MKKGFTLVELLGVIVLLALIGLLVIPIVDRATEDARDTSYEEQIQFLIEASKSWAAKYTEQLPTDSDSAAYLGIADLQVEGFISSDEVRDPRNNKKMDGCIKITYESIFNRYNYQYYEESCEFLRIQ